MYLSFENFIKENDIKFVKCETPHVFDSNQKISIISLDEFYSHQD